MLRSLTIQQLFIDVYHSFWSKNTIVMINWMHDSEQVQLWTASLQNFNHTIHTLVLTRARPSVCILVNSNIMRWTSTAKMNNHNIIALSSGYPVFNTHASVCNIETLEILIGPWEWLYTGTCNHHIIIIQCSIVLYNHNIIVQINIWCGYKVTIIQGIIISTKYTVTSVGHWHT